MAGSAQEELRIAVVGLGRASGAHAPSLELSRALAALCRVSAFIGREAHNRTAWESAARDAGFSVSVWPAYSSFAGALGSVVFPIRIRRLAAAVRADQPDLILVPMAHLWVLPLMRRLTNIPWLVTIHDPLPHPGFQARLANYLEGRIVRRADGVVTPTLSFVNVIAKKWSIPSARISSAPLGPYGELHPRSEARATRPHAFTVLFFGRMLPYKGVEVLLRAAPLLAEKRPDIRVRLVGSNAGPRLAARALECHNVELQEGWVDDEDLGEIFAGADLVVLPYTSASQSGVIPLAAPFALPIVASDTGGLCEQLNGGDCGLLVPPGDEHALAEAIIQLAEDPSAARSLGEALRHEYLDNRSWQMIASHYVRAGRGAIEGHSAARAL